MNFPFHILRRSKSASLNIEDMISLGKLHLSLVSFHLTNQDINAALESGKQAINMQRNLNKDNLFEKKRKRKAKSVYLYLYYCD